MEKLLKRYVNRKLYDTEESRYVNLTDVFDMVKRGQQVKVLDVSTLEPKDITASTLLQALVQSDAGDLTTDTLVSMIRNNPVTNNSLGGVK